MRDCCISLVGQRSVPPISWRRLLLKYLGRKRRTRNCIDYKKNFVVYRMVKEGRDCLLFRKQQISMGENSVIDCGQSTPTSNNSSAVVTTPASASPTSNNELDSSGSSASGGVGPNGCHNSAGSPASTTATSASAYSVEYLAQLLKDKKQLAAFPNVFHHIERLIDEG